MAASLAYGGGRQSRCPSLNTTRYRDLHTASRNLAAARDVCINALES